MTFSVLYIIETAAVVGLLSAIASTFYRLRIHPLAQIPGPKLAAISWWYEFYFDVIQQGRYVFKIQELHKQYGPIIRVTPDEIHINDVGFLDTIYAPASSQRDKYPYQLRSLRVPGGVGTTPSHAVHKRRREALSQFFSKRNVAYLEPFISNKVEELCRLIAKHAAEKTPINLSHAFFAFSNDVVTNVLFAHQTDILADEEKAAKLHNNSYELLLGVHINKHFPWIPDFLESLPLFISKPLMPPGLIDMLELFDRVRAELIAIMKVKASAPESSEPLGPTGKESVYSSVLDNPMLPQEEKSLLRLEQEGALLVLAGTESPAKSLNIIFYHLLANPPILKRLRDELSTVEATASWVQLEKLEYLGGVIEEGNRLSFGVTARPARIANQVLTYEQSEYVTTPGPLPAKSFVIPPGTPMSTTTLAAHTATRVFPDPFVFNPDRWLGKDGKERKKFQMAFGKGGRKCLGIELAKAELYLVVARLVKRFDMELWETGPKDVDFKHAFQVAMPEFGSEGIKVVAKS